MRNFPVPRVVVSQCLEFGEVRYNGAVIPDKTVQRLKPFVEFIPVCPEVGIGLGVPRDAIRIVNDGEERLVQPKTGKDLTEDMQKYTASFLSSLPGVDGFLLKSRSPTCGMQDVKVYQHEEHSQVIGKTTGMFSKEILNHYGGLAIEEEGRMKNFTLRNHFLTKLFTLASFREVKENPEVKHVQSFHEHNKYLFMAHHPGRAKQMGRILANHDRLSLEEVAHAYEAQLHALLEHPPEPQSHINVCQHIAGYFKKTLSQKEKAGFQSLLEQYKEEKIPLSAVMSVLQSWINRFEENYLACQTYFEPFPIDLVEISDSGKGRAYS
ncbi:DUF523 and DUF1722 domain-containing protein [Halobacillus locisalis]|uniref:DUF523 and DUF1722 domain-containing protein n=1 Tax=Halobacillus locisalis TaxID=220753 RepID=A0A838CST3_9BACI|nr:DUF523 and DUF1722 domain-containing protein [Halobacillus locisalis]